MPGGRYDGDRRSASADFRPRRTDMSTGEQHVRFAGRVQAEQVSLNLGAAGTVQGGQTDMHYAGAVAVVTGDSVSVRQGGAQWMLAAEDVTVDLGGAVAMAAANDVHVTRDGRRRCWPATTCT